MNDEQFATAFAHEASAYELGRPGYPPEAIATVRGELRLQRASLVVDLAAGTGKLTRDLLSRFDRVIAIEPLAEMRTHLARTAPLAHALEGTAEHMPLPDAAVDAIFVAQAFHWFDGPAALDEIARVLKAGGGLSLLWNTTPWELREGVWYAQLDDLLERSRADLSLMRRHGSGRWRHAFQGDLRFSPLSHLRFDNTRRMGRDQFLSNLASRSYIARLDPDARREVLAEVARLLSREDAPLDAGAVLVPMRTEVYWTRRRSD